MKTLWKLAEYLLGLGALLWIIILAPAFITGGDILKGADLELLGYTLLIGIAMMCLSTVIMAFVALGWKFFKNPA